MVITSSHRKIFSWKNSGASTNDSFPTPIKCQTVLSFCLFSFLSRLENADYARNVSWLVLPTSLDDRVTSILQSESRIAKNSESDARNPGPFITSQLYYGRSEDVPLIPTQRGQIMQWDAANRPINQISKPKNWIHNSKWIRRAKLTLI